MSEMKNYMMDIEEFCDGYFYGEGAMNDFSIEEVSEDAKKYFGTSMAKDHAVAYLTKTLGEFQGIEREVVMNNFNGMSTSDPERYRKINAVLNEKGKKKDLLDRVETVPLEYVYDLVDDGPSPEDSAILSELKTYVTASLATLTSREERVLRKRFSIGLPTNYTYEEIGQEFSVTKERIRQIETKALNKLKSSLN